MSAAKCSVRFEDVYLVVVLDPELDREWGAPQHVVWANPEASPQEGIILQPSDDHASAPVNRSKLEALLILTPHMPLYAFLSDRGVPSTYQGEIDSAGRLCLTQLH
jgi:hypothetical protein